MEVEEAGTAEMFLLCSPRLVLEVMQSSGISDRLTLAKEVDVIGGILFLSTTSRSISYRLATLSVPRN